MWEPVTARENAQVTALDEVFGWGSALAAGEGFAVSAVGAACSDWVHASVMGSHAARRASEVWKRPHP